jgi:hypothetical protein
LSFLHRPGPNSIETATAQPITAVTHHARSARDLFVTAWFVASAESLGGCRGLPDGLEAPPDPEAVRDAKSWLSDRMTGGRSYAPTRDQAALVSAIDLTLAQRSRSFRKLVRELERIAEGQEPAI